MVLILEFIFSYVKKINVLKQCSSMKYFNPQIYNKKLINNVILVKRFKLKKKVETKYPRLINKFNDTGLYFSKYRFLFWSEHYPVLTNSSLSTSLEFNSSIEKHFYVLNNLEDLIQKEDFFFTNTFEKIDFMFNPTANIFDEVSRTDYSLSNNKSTDYLLSYINNNNKYLIRNFTRTSVLSTSFILKFYQHYLKLNTGLQFLTFWKLSANFTTKNLDLTNFSKVLNTSHTNHDVLNLNWDFEEEDDYTFRLYDNYNSSEFNQNNLSVFTKFMSDYDHAKKKSESNNVIENANLRPMGTNLNSILLYSYYLDSDITNKYLDLMVDTNLILIRTVLRKSLNFTNKSRFYINYLKSKFIFKNKRDLKSLFSNNIKLYKNKRSAVFFKISSKFNIHSSSTLFFNYINFHPIQNFVSKSNFRSVNKIKRFNPILSLTPTLDKQYSLDIKLNSIGFTSNPHEVHIDDIEETTCILLSTSGSSFIIQHIGLFLHFKLFFFKPKFENFKFKFKKKIFSFYKTNEIKQTLMEHRKSLFIFKYIDSRNLLWDKRVEHDYSNYNLSLDFYLKKSIELKSLSNLNFYKNKYLSNLVGYDRSTVEIGYTDYLKKFTLDPKYRQIEFKIPRVRFNPGYQRLWREYRLALANAIRFRYIYQRQLTRYLARFYECLREYNILALEYKIWKIIIYSRLLPDLHSIKDFMDNSLIFLNGKILKNENHIIVVNDIVQLQVSAWYYIYYKWLTSWNNMRIKKFKKLIYRKKIASAYTIIKSLKQKSRYTPLYIYNMRFDMSDTKSYLEIDYFTLSFIFIYDNFALDMSSPDDFIEMRHYVYRMYNWKYIN